MYVYMCLCVDQCTLSIYCYVHVCCMQTVFSDIDISCRVGCCDLYFVSQYVIAEQCTNWLVNV